VKNGVGNHYHEKGMFYKNTILFFVRKRFLLLLNVSILFLRSWTRGGKILL